MHQQNSDNSEINQPNIRNPRDALLAQLINRILSDDSIDNNSRSFAAYFMAQVMSMPEECTVQIDNVVMPLEPLTESNLQILRNAVVNGDVTVSLSLEL